MDGVTDALIRNNVIVENHATGIAIFQQDGAVCSRRIEVLHNTIVQAEDGRWGITVGTGGCRDLTFINNVLLTRHAWRGSIELPTAGVPGLLSDSNVIADRFSIDDGDTSISLSQWQAATGQDLLSSIGTIGGTLTLPTYRPNPKRAGPRRWSGDRRRHRCRPSVATARCGVGHRRLRDAVVWRHRRNDRRVAIRRCDRGTAGDDVIAALSGADLITAGGGNDLVCGGGGPDVISGNAGSDDLRGNTGADELRGHAGDDALYGGKQQDDLYGGSGTDRVDGGPGTDRCAGGETYFSCEG